MSWEEIKLERQINKHRNRNVGYHFQLPAFEKMVRRSNAVPMLDSNIVNLLEALTDLLGEIGEFHEYRAPNVDEYDLRGLDVSFSFGCQYCNEKCFDVMQALDHVMLDAHSQQSDKTVKKLERFRKNASEHYDTFLIRKHEIMIKNKLIKSSLNSLMDLYFVTKSFLKMTSQYLNSLRILNLVPTTIVARGVIDLLKQIDSLISRAKCIQSIPEFNSMIIHLLKLDVKFVSKGNVFDDVHAAISHATNTSGLKSNIAPSVVRNIFSLPPPTIVNPEFHQNTLVGSPIVKEPPMTTRPDGLRHSPNIVPFTAIPPIRMLPPMRPPMVLDPNLAANMHMITVEQQQFQQMILNPALAIAQHSRNFFLQQQQMPYHTLPSLPNQVEVGCSSISPELPPISNTHQKLPPLTQSGTAEHPFFTPDVKYFLENFQLDSLIENGNYLINFDKSSVIPVEIEHILKAVAPDVKVECFGAKVSGVGYEEDFINLYVDDGNKTKTDESVQLLFTKLMSFFTTNCDEWVIQNTEEAGVRTHLTVKNNCENLCCRISFASEIYCSNSKLIRYYTKTFPMCQQLCYFVQEFVKLIDLDFNRYIIVVLVIFYMQQRDYLPTITQLQSNLLTEELCGPWLINFDPKSPEELKLKSCPNDLRSSATDFFQFYGTQFSFQDSVVCPQIGMAVNRSDFYADNDWRMPVKRYKAYLDAKNKVRFVPTPMCVQDLLELTTNVTRMVSSKHTEKFVGMCKLAYQFYTNNQ